jgi:uncharacterized protein (TIGR00299 family) protein
MPHDFHEHEHESHPAHEHARAPLRAQAPVPAEAENAATQPAREREALPAGAGRGKLLFVDAFSGIAGDMLVAGLVDLGVPVAVISQALGTLPLSGYELCFVQRTRSAICARGLEVRVHAPQPSRAYVEIRQMIEQAGELRPGARMLALAAFGLLAEAEAEVHGTTPERVHFHEVGAVDSIADIVGAAVALDYLGADLISSPLPIGRGFTRSQHGLIPLPAPATVLCLRGVPTYDAGIDAELVTPTGACLLRATAKSFTRWPNLRPLRVGWGAGTRELADRPNLLRLVLGDAQVDLQAEGSGHVVLELNVDDMSGELMAFALTRAHEAGALDTWSTPIGMKKGRPAVMLSALARRGDQARVAHALLAETTSLGLRVREVGRIERPRRMHSVQTAYGPIPLKIADGDGIAANVAPEYEACRSAAEAHGVPVKQVFAAALAAYHGQG